MILNSFLLIIGLVLLFYCSDILVDNASSIATSLSVRPIVVGLTIVAFGTSAPELLVSLFASFSGESGISIGNILGSNVMNIALVLGASVIVKPIRLKTRGRVNKELFFMITASALFWVMCSDGSIGRINGIILVTMLLMFLAYSYMTSKKSNTDDAEIINDSEKKMFKKTVLIITGIAGLCVGANLVVTNAVAIADFYNISKTFIGISVVAFGTSLPELATSIIAAKKGESEIAIGNVIGSNMFNICMVMGIVGILSPLQVEPGLNRFEFPFMVFISIILAVFLNTSDSINRKHGIFLIITFIIYIAVSWHLTVPAGQGF